MASPTKTPTIILTVLSFVSTEVPCARCRLFSGKDDERLLSLPSLPLEEWVAAWVVGSHFLSWVVFLANM